MNKFRKIILFVVLCMTTCTIFAQDVVSLVVSGEGKDKNEATQNALRSAIEQTFGTFVSANTTILNDQLVADLISNNIKEYNYITENRHSDGNYYVTLSVDVALKQLVTYAKSKGSECEFAGATFGANVKQYKFYLESSRKVLNNLRLQCVEMAPFLYDYELEVGEPQIDGTVEFTVKVLANDNTKTFGDLIINTLEAIEFDSIYAKQLERMGIKTEKVNFYAVKRLTDKNISSGSSWEDLLSLIMFQDSHESLLTKAYKIKRAEGTIRDSLKNELVKGKYLPDELLSSGGSANIFIVDYNKETSSIIGLSRMVSRLQIQSYGNFVIRDNLDNEYSVVNNNREWPGMEVPVSSTDTIIRNILFGKGDVHDDYTQFYHYESYDSDVDYYDYGVSRPFVSESIFFHLGPHAPYYDFGVFGCFNIGHEKGEQCFEVHLEVKIPLDTLMNISKFTVERKETKF